MNRQADQRLMDATIRFARRNLARTSTNPSVGCLIVQFDSGQPKIVGRSITAAGGRPHAEPLALEEAGSAARGATAYVTLEPCAHHGATPSCARTLIDAGISRVVTGWTDPDIRVDGQGHQMLRDAGIEVIAGVSPDRARRGLDGYLSRKQRGRPFVTIKLAVSRDGRIGRSDQAAGKGQVAITGPVAGLQTHMLRSINDAILIGSNTARIDDPLLTCRLPGMQGRSPQRFVLDSRAELDVNSQLARSTREVALSIVCCPEAPAKNIARLERLGLNIVAGELINGYIALPELLYDMAERGISSLFVEGGARVVQQFLDAGLADQIALFESRVHIGAGGIASPITGDIIPAGFERHSTSIFGDDKLSIYRQEQN